MSPRRTNRSDLDDLTATQRTAVAEGAVALDNLQGRASFNAWMQVARGIVPLCALADKPGRSRNARRSLFREAGYGSLSAANVSRLLHMGRFESQIAIWRMGLKPRQRDTWNSPATICKKCPDVRKAIEEANKNRPPRAPRRRPTVDPRDELDRAINHVFDLVNAVDDIDLRREQIERLITLLGELREPERTQPEVRAKPAAETLEWETEKRAADSPLPARHSAKYSRGEISIDPGFSLGSAGFGPAHFSVNYQVKNKGTLHIADAPTVEKAKALAERRIRQAPSVDEALEAQVKESAARARAVLSKLKARKRG